MYKVVQLHKKITPSIFLTRLDYKIIFTYILFNRLNLFTNKMKKFILNPHYDYDVIERKKVNEIFKISSQDKMHQPIILLLTKTLRKQHMKWRRKMIYTHQPLGVNACGSVQRHVCVIQYWCIIEMHLQNREVERQI